MDALVTDGQSRAAVTGVRALGGAGLRVLAAGPARGAPALWSRHARGRALCPPPSSPGFVERIGELAVEHGPLVVHPGQEEALDPLAAAGSLPPEAILPFATGNALAALRDKRNLTALAESVGLTGPATLATGPAGALAASPPSTPCVVKSPGMSAALPQAVMIDDAAQLRALLAALPAAEPVVIQERLARDLSALSLVVDREGRIVARFQQAARRMWPPRGGASTLSVSIDPDEDLVRRGRRLLADAGFWGMAQIQFLTGARSHAVIDVNPRFYGSMPLALAAGVNLPAAAHAVALGRSLPDPAPYPSGVTYRWLEGDVLAALKGHPRQLLPGRGRPRAGAMWAADDPVPSAILAAHAAWSPLRARLSRSWPSGGR